MKKLILAITMIFIMLSCSFWKSETGTPNETQSGSQKQILGNSETDDKTQPEEKQEDITGKYCTLEDCLENWEKLEEQGEELVQYFKTDDSTEKQSYKRSPRSYSVYKKDGSYMRKIISMWKDYSYIETIKYWNYYVKKEFSKWCEWESIKQIILDSQWKETSENITKLKDEIKIWDYTWKLKLNFNTRYKLSSKSQTVFTYSPSTTFVQSSVLNTSEEAIKYIEEDIYNESLLSSEFTQENRRKYYYSENWIAQDYLFEVDKNLYAVYETTDFKEPNWVVYLWDNDDFLNLEEKEEINFMDLKTTQKLVLSYSEWGSKWVVWKNWDKLKIVKRSDLPIFKVKKLDDKWYFLLYTVSDYKISDLISADVCK